MTEYVNFSVSTYSFLSIRVIHIMTIDSGKVVVEDEQEGGGRGGGGGGGQGKEEGEGGGRGDGE